jgi:dihydrodipicolinate synthase/N-acetylneuraminate lyase
MLSDLKGSVIIAQTPFDDRGAVDLASIDTLTDFYLRHGADGFVVLGVSGECWASAARGRASRPRKPWRRLALHRARRPSQ